MLDLRARRWLASVLTLSAMLGVAPAAEAAPSQLVTVPAAGSDSVVVVVGDQVLVADGKGHITGDARWGSLAGVALAQPITAAASVPGGGGYWLAASDGGVFAFGSAWFYGGLAHVRLNQRIVSMAATPTGRGYWLVASDGGVFSFGDAHFFGSTGSIRLNSPIVDIAASPDGAGYWLAAADGGVFAFGSAWFYGSAPSSTPTSAIVAADDGAGYRIVRRDGTVEGFGSAVDATAAVPSGHHLVSAAASGPTLTVAVAPAAPVVPRGQLALCPVGGGHDFIDSWGFPRSGGRRHKGVDMMARSGVPVVAPVSGTVTHRSNRVGGRSFHLDGDDGNTYYGTHMSGYGKGGRVEAGEVIGYVGDDGNARGMPHLHFEIREGGRAINPYPRVAAVCAGAR